MDITNVMTLDENAVSLTKAGFAFHTGGGFVDGNDGTSNSNVDRLSASGSNWARGKAGMNFEFRGNYHGEDGFFNWTDIVELDYCAPNGFGVKRADDVTYCPELEAKP